jgi:hypothetical protein
MATRAELHEEVDALGDEQVPRARLVVEGEAEGDVVGLPDSWKRTATGEPMPNVVAAVRAVRDEH